MGTHSTAADLSLWFRLFGVFSGKCDPSITMVTGEDGSMVWTNISIRCEQIAYSIGAHVGCPPWYWSESWGKSSEGNDGGPPLPSEPPGPSTSASAVVCSWPPEKR